MVRRFPFHTHSLVLAALAVAWIGGCQSPPTGQSSPPPGNIPIHNLPVVLAHTPRAEPLIRVRISRSVDHVHVTTFASAISVWPDAGPDSSALNFPPGIGVTISRSSGAYLLTLDDPDKTSYRWALDRCIIRTGGGGNDIAVDGKPFPGDVFLDAAPGGQVFDVINRVPLEEYLPGVLAKELFPNWHEETYRAQAVAARSYAMVEIAKHQNDMFDVESTQASQAYVGITQNATALSAVRATRGVVLSWQGLVLPAYYSSCCGGRGQDADLALADAPDLQPLKGRDHGDDCAASPNFRWGPIRRDVADLSRRIAAWGTSRSHDIASLRSIRGIEVTARNSAGRPARFAITDSAGRRFTLGPEEFRFACNYSTLSMAPLPGASELKSSDVEAHVSGATVTFSNGQGFGHGVGMCQYGAQNYALQGYTAQAILAFYYPGAVIETAY